VYGNAKVYDNAHIFNYAKVYDSAWVYNRAVVYDDARVYGEARIFDDAQIYNYAQVFGNANIFGNAKVFDYAKVCEYTRVYGFAWICGYAEVCCGSTVCGNEICGKAVVCGDKWGSSPLQIQGSDYFFSVSSKNSITMNYETRTVTEWRKTYGTFFGNHLFTESKEAEYKMYFNLAAMLYGWKDFFPLYDDSGNDLTESMLYALTRVKVLK